MSEELFTEYRPANEGRNLMHHRFDGVHIAGSDCPCKPTEVPHEGKATR